jgi:hypothetical protein
VRRFQAGTYTFNLSNMAEAVVWCDTATVTVLVPNTSNDIDPNGYIGWVSINWRNNYLRLQLLTREMLLYK